MILNIEGVTEEIYGLWHNRSPQSIIPVIENEKHLALFIGFDANVQKNFDLDIGMDNYQIFMKVDSHKTYDTYRDHLIVLVKMLIQGNPDREFTVNIYIVSDRHELYKNELWTFFNLSNSYNRYRSFGQHGVLIKNFSMGLFGFRITDFCIKLIALFKKRILGIKE